jgi:hypothetical protein
VKRINILDKGSCTGEFIMDDPPMFNEEKIRGIFKVLEEELPVLLEKMASTLYEPEKGQKIGKAVGNFFKEMKEAGMGDIPAAKITAIYASNLSLRGMMGGMGGMSPMGGMGPMGNPMMGKHMGPHPGGPMSSMHEPE